MEHIFSLEFLKKLSEQLKKREIKGLPEQIAFNLVMAIVPLLVVIVQLGTYLSLNTDLVEYLIMAYAPNELKLLLMNLFPTTSTPSGNIFFLITTGISFMWLISKGFYGIAAAANTTYQVPYMKFAYLERIFSFLIVIFMILSLALVTVFALFGQGLIILIFKILNIHIQSHLLLIFNIIKSQISFLGYFSFFFSLFYLAPSIKMRVGEIIPGALVTSIGWSVSSIGFTFYANHIANYNKFYGSLSVIIMLLFWLFILGYTIMIGLQVNYILKRDYFGGVSYEQKLGIFNRFRYLSKWTKFAPTEISDSK